MAFLLFTFNLNRKTRHGHSIHHHFERSSHHFSSYLVSKLLSHFLECRSAKFGRNVKAPFEAGRIEFAEETSEHAVSKISTLFHFFCLIQFCLNFPVVAEAIKLSENPNWTLLFTEKQLANWKIWSHFVVDRFIYVFILVSSGEKSGWWTLSNTLWDQELSIDIFSIKFQFGDFKFDYRRYENSQLRRRLLIVENAFSYAYWGCSVEWMIRCTRRRCELLRLNSLSKCLNGMELKNFLNFVLDELAFFLFREITNYKRGSKKEYSKKKMTKVEMIGENSS